MKLHAVLLSLAALATGPAWSVTVDCPDLAAAVQVGACPTEEELRYTYTGYCSDNARMYAKDATCVDYRDYRALKNIALWESADGEFHAYLSCDKPPPGAVKPVAVDVGKQAGITRLICRYADGTTFIRRTRAACKVAGDGDCAANPSACRASCD
jgi:hypothetical protein